MTAEGGTDAQPVRVLVAGVGNIFLSDDGFGVEAVGRLAAAGALPDGVETTDTGVRGVHLAYRILDGYDTVVLVDATCRGRPPGTVYLIDASEPEVAGPQDTLVDGHRMTPGTVLRLLDTLCAGTGCDRPRRILVVGCEPQCLDEGIGLSAPVAGAVDEAVALVLRVLEGSGGRTPVTSADESGDGALPSSQSADRPAARSQR